MVHTPVQENNLEIRIYAWNSILPFYFYFNKTNYARYGKGISVQAQSSHHVWTSIGQHREHQIDRDAKTTG